MVFMVGLLNVVSWGRSRSCPRSQWLYHFIAGISSHSEDHRENATRSGKQSEIGRSLRPKGFARWPPSQTCKNSLPPNMHNVCRFIRFIFFVCVCVALFYWTDSVINQLYRFIAGISSHSEDHRENATRSGKQSEIGPSLRPKGFTRWSAESCGEIGRGRRSVL